MYRMRLGIGTLICRISQSPMCPLGVEVLRGNISAMVGFLKGDMFPPEHWWEKTGGESRFSRQTPWGNCWSTYRCQVGWTHGCSTGGGVGQKRVPRGFMANVSWYLGFIWRQSISCRLRDLNVPPGRRKKMASVTKTSIITEASLCARRAL